jgi:prepilin-type N-terminal cleavage/methylation domain-containing protein
MKLALAGPARCQIEGFFAQAVLPIVKHVLNLNPIVSGSIAWKSREPKHSRDFRPRGFTLVELTVAIAVILVLVGAASLAVKPYYAFRDGRAAGEMLRSVKAAQLMYLSDYPSTPVANLTQAGLLPYMPNGTWPTLPSYNGVVPTINCTVFPPVASIADPSGSTTDGLWDVGQY